MPHNIKKIGCIADFSSPKAKDSFSKLMKKYDFIDANSFDTSFDALVVLGGDGMMLKVLHRYMDSDVLIYGMNRGTMGFLMNSYDEEDLIKRIKNSSKLTIHPLEMLVTKVGGEAYSELAVNEVSLLRETNQAAKISIKVNDVLQLDSLVCDGVMVSTPAGSTAYNLAAHGPILPLDSNLLTLTPISPFRPRRWRGALLSHNDKIEFEILNPEKRPVSAVADFIEHRDVTSVQITEKRNISLNLLFDKANNINDRVLKEQFMP